MTPPSRASFDLNLPHSCCPRSSVATAMSAAFPPSLPLLPASTMQITSCNIIIIIVVIASVSYDRTVRFGVRSTVLLFRYGYDTFYAPPNILVARTHRSMHSSTMIVQLSTVVQSQVKKLGQLRQQSAGLTMLQRGPTI